MLRTTVGEFEVTVLSDGTYELDGGAFFGVVPKVMWEKRIQPDARNMLNGGHELLFWCATASGRCWSKPALDRS